MLSAFGTEDWSRVHTELGVFEMKISTKPLPGNLLTILALYTALFLSVSTSAIADPADSVITKIIDFERCCPEQIYDSSRQFSFEIEAGDLGSPSSDLPQD